METLVPVPAPAMKPIGLMDLPVELRLKIFRYCLPCGYRFHLFDKPTFCCTWIDHGYDENWDDWDNWAGRDPEASDTHEYDESDSDDDEESDSDDDEESDSDDDEESDSDDNEESDSDDNDESDNEDIDDDDDSESEDVDSESDSIPGPKRYKAPYEQKFQEATGTGPCFRHSPECLLLLNRQIREEALDILYSENLFMIDLNYELHNDMETISEGKRYRIRHLMVNIDFFDYHMERGLGRGLSIPSHMWGPILENLRSLRLVVMGPWDIMYEHSVGCGYRTKTLTLWLHYLAPTLIHLGKKLSPSATVMVDDNGSEETAMLLHMCLPQGYQQIRTRNGDLRFHERVEDFYVVRGCRVEFPGPFEFHLSPDDYANQGRYDWEWTRRLCCSYKTRKN